MMARLIDADALIQNHRNDVTNWDNPYAVKISSIENAPTVDAVEVVRCRYCAKDGLFTCPICFIENKTLHFINHSPDFYCGEGERKDGDDYG